MKSERRHELQHNALANWLENAGDNLRPYANHVLIGLIALIAVFIAGMWWKGQTEATSQEIAKQINFGFLNQRPEMLTSVAEKFPTEKSSPYAMIAAANMYLGGGAERLFSSKALAMQELDKASKTFTRAAEMSQDAEVQSQATFGLARTAECQANVDEALKLYKTVQEKWPKSPLAKFAAERRTDLEKKSTKEFFDKFAVFDPKPVVKDSALDGMKLPEFTKDNIPKENSAPAGSSPVQPATK